VRCHHCGTPLALVACPACFTRLLRGTRYRPHCGAEAARAGPPSERAPRPCSRCRETLAAASVGLDRLADAATPTLPDPRRGTVHALSTSAER
jgi:hypothetical protein